MAVQTDGISPKVKAVFYGLGGPGLILLIVGFAIGDDTLKTAGITALIAALGGGGLGYAAQPGKTKETP
jgi:hypothetical protein